MGISTQNRETDRQTETGRQAGRQPGRQRHTLRRWTVLDTITSGSLQHAYCEMVHHKVDTTVRWYIATCILWNVHHNIDTTVRWYIATCILWNGSPQSRYYTVRWYIATCVLPDSRNYNRHNVRWTKTTSILSDCTSQHACDSLLVCLIKIFLPILLITTGNRLTPLRFLACGRNYSSRRYWRSFWFWLAALQPQWRIYL